MAVSGTGLELFAERERCHHAITVFFQSKLQSDRLVSTIALCIYSLQIQLLVTSNESKNSMLEESSLEHLPILDFAFNQRQDLFRVDPPTS